VATSGADALKIIDTQNIDLVLLDIVMPVMDGYEVLDKIKKSEKNSKVPVIFLSSMDDKESILNGFSKGAVDYISKPIQKEILIARVNTHLNLHFLQQKLEKTIEKQKKMIILQTKKAAMGEMISIISHQLVQPLNAISLANDFVSRYVTKNCTNQDEISVFIEKIKNHIEYMSDTIDDYKNFFNPNREVKLFSVEDSINKALSILEKNIISNNIEIVKNTPTDELYVLGHENDLVQVILNILSNAKDALKADCSESAKVIEIDLSKSEHAIVLKISDNGIGIEQKSFEHIFEDYFSTKGSNGTGIGLHLSKMIIEDIFLGSIKAFSRDNKTIFEIELDSGI
jgi:C4-dicarboxylate-specific signal transduction histidine kinase